MKGASATHGGGARAGSTYGDCWQGRLANRLVPFAERCGARVVPGSLDHSGFDLEWHGEFVSVRFAGPGRFRVIAGGRIVGEARLEPEPFADDDGRPASDQFPVFPAMASIRLDRSNDWGDGLAMAIGHGFSPACDDEIDPDD